MQGIWSYFFWGRRWINNQRKSNAVWYNTPHWKIIALICCARRSPKVTLIAVFVSIVAWKQALWPPLFISFFNISLSCNINIPSFIGNLWWDLLLGNHLNTCGPHFQIKLEFGVLVFVEGGTRENPKKNPRSKDENMWRRVRKSNPGHSGGRRALSPLRHPCSPCMHNVVH